MKLTNKYIVDMLLSDKEILEGFIEANEEANDELFENVNSEKLETITSISSDN